MFRFLRWLLVAVLPFLGLYLGSRLTPELKPVWEMSFPQMMLDLGVVDAGRIFLLGETHDYQSGTGYQLQAIIGIDTSTSAQLFRHELPEEVRNDSHQGSRRGKVTPEGNLIVFFNGPKKMIHLYDWKRKEIIQRYQCNPQYQAMNEAVLRNNVLVGYTWNHDPTKGEFHSYIVVWDQATELPKWSIEVGEQAQDLYLSDDGKVAAICTETRKLDELVLVDTMRGTIIQKIPGYFQDVRWSSNSQGMHIVNNEIAGISIQHYERQNGKYILTTRDLISQPPVVATHNNDYFVLRRYIGSTPFRRKLHEMFNSLLNSILDHLWPVTCAISLHEPETSETIRSMTLPDTRNPGPLYPTNNLEGVIIPNGKSLAYWSFASVSMWPQWLGLFIGVLLASLLAWSNLRRAPRKAI